MSLFTLAELAVSPWAPTLTCEKSGDKGAQGSQHGGSGGGPAAAQRLGTPPPQEVRRELDGSQEEEIPELIAAEVRHVVGQAVVEEVVA